MVDATALYPSRYASIRTFDEPILRRLGAYDEIRLDSGSTLKALQSSDRSPFLSDGPSPYAQSPLEIRSDRASRARSPLQGRRCRYASSLHLLFSFARALSLSSLLLSV